MAMSPRRKSLMTTALALMIVLMLQPMASAVWNPNDTGWPIQDWATTVRLNQAWDQASDPIAIADSLGSDSVLVAVPDTGFMHHPDLEPHYFVNEREIPGNGVDDDGNGYIDDVHGWDFVSNDGEPVYQNGDCLESSPYHGTHVAGLIAATADNGNAGIPLGRTASIAGSAQVTILPIRIPGEACGFGSKLAEALDYARVMGADIISMSLYVLGGGTPLQQAAVQRAYDAGILMTAPAICDGNDMAFPANDWRVVSVFGLKDDRTPWPGGCGGNEAELSAPVETVLSLWWNVANQPDTISLSGHSAGPPIVAGVAALIKSYRSDLDGKQIRQILRATATDLGATIGWDATFGYGLVDADTALKAANKVRNQAWGENAFANGAYVSGPDAQPSV